ncbi:MAG TPA: DUF6263 family protein [Candidatus Hydrogenedentes bacterium]|nr:DUF6263 family protein [Candidatus Hydrogenedentota bacterium]HOS01561.1 DUF6263 family protein [Candidatus Hydrogenedentota bacterium]
MGIFQRARDAAAVRRVLTGDPDAFRSIVSAYGGAVQWVAYAHLGNREEAEEVCQETFLKAFQSLHSLREISQLGHWLLSIARNLSRDVLRKRAREAESLNQVSPSDAVHPQPDRTEVHERVRAHLNALDDEDREVLVLCYFDGCRAPEIARFFGISHVAARKRLQRARQVLGKRLVRELGDDIARTKPARPHTEKYMALVLAAPVPIRPDIASGLTKTGGIVMAAVSKKVAVGVAVAVLLCSAPLVVGIFASRTPHDAYGDYVSMTLNFTPGEIFTIQQDQTSTQHIDLPNKPMDIPSSSTSVMDMEILAVEADGSARIKGAYQSVSVNYGSGPLAELLKSGVDVGASIGEALSGRSFTFLLSPEGEVGDIEGLAEVHKAALESLQVPENARPLIDQMIQKICSPENLKATGSGFFLYLPGKAVRVGESWSKLTIADFGLALSTKNTWTLKEVRPDAIVLARTMEIFPAPGNGDSSLPGKMDISGTGAGVVEIDPATGWIRSSQTTIETAGTMAIPAGQTPQGKIEKVNVKNTGVSSTVVTRKK